MPLFAPILAGGAIIGMGWKVYTDWKKKHGQSQEETPPPEPGEVQSTGNPAPINFIGLTGLGGMHIVRGGSGPSTKAPPSTPIAGDGFAVTIKAKTPGGTVNVLTKPNGRIAGSVPDNAHMFSKGVFDSAGNPNQSAITDSTSVWYQVNDSLAPVNHTGAPQPALVGYVRGDYVVIDNAPMIAPQPAVLGH